MKTNAPKFTTWLIAIILGVVGIFLFLAGKWAPYNFWLLVVGFALLALATLFKGL
jgi:hypothetical protein